MVSHEGENNEAILPSCGTIRVCKRRGHFKMFMKYWCSVQHFSNKICFCCLFLQYLPLTSMGPLGSPKPGRPLSHTFVPHAPFSCPRIPRSPRVIISHLILQNKHILTTFPLHNLCVNRSTQCLESPTDSSCKGLKTHCHPFQLPGGSPWVSPHCSRNLSPF